MIHFGADSTIVLSEELKNKIYKIQMWLFLAMSVNVVSVLDCSGFTTVSHVDHLLQFDNWKNYFPIMKEKILPYYKIKLLVR